MTANESISSSVPTQGTDEEGLGRWSWMRFTRKTSVPRIIVVYIYRAKQEFKLCLLRLYSKKDIGVYKAITNALVKY